MDLSAILWFAFELTGPDTNSFCVIQKVSEPHLCVYECVSKRDRDKERDIKKQGKQLNPGIYRCLLKWFIVIIDILSLSLL